MLKIIQGQLQSDVKTVRLSKFESFERANDALNDHKAAQQRHRQT